MVLPTASQGMLDGWVGEVMLVVWSTSFIAVGYAMSPPPEGRILDMVSCSMHSPAESKCPGHARSGSVSGLEEPQEAFLYLGSSLRLSSDLSPTATR